MADITVARQFKEHVMAMDSDGEFTQIEVPYVVFGTDEEEKALAAVHGEAPEEWEGLPIESLEISSREGNEAFTVSVIYKNRASSTSSSKEKEEDEPTVSFDFGCVPYVPVPRRWLHRDLRLREACRQWGVKSYYATHHYGWWECVAAELGRWSSWQNFQPDYDALLKKIAVRDYGLKAARPVLSAWEFWSRAMDFYTASNEDQYGPWRVGAAYPFIFQPNLTRTMGSREMKFPAAPQAHFGGAIVKTLYQPFENEQQSPGFLRYPAELRSLKKMLSLWEKGLAALQRISSGQRNDELERLQALGHFIRNSIRTTIHIKQWWQLNTALQNAGTALKAGRILDQLEVLLDKELDNARDTVPVVETDSRLGWEPSMEYVCDPWHLNWKIRQLENTRIEITTFRKIL